MSKRITKIVEVQILLDSEKYEGKDGKTYYKTSGLVPESRIVLDFIRTEKAVKAGDKIKMEMVLEVQYVRPVVK